MQIVPNTAVEYLRYNSNDATRFPNPWEATQEQLRSVPYIAEVWSDETGLIHYDASNEVIVVSFDDIMKDFEAWDQTVEECPYDNVYEYLADCIDHGLHPCKLL